MVIAACFKLSVQAASVDVSFIDHISGSSSHQRLYELPLTGSPAEFVPKCTGGWQVYR